MPSRALVFVTSRLCWIALLVAASVICSLGTASVASADPCFAGGSPSGDPYTVPASGVSSVRISVNGQSGMPWRGVDSSGHLLAYNDGGLGSTLVADVRVTPGEVLQAGWLAGAAGGDSPDLANYYQNGTNTTYQGTDPGGTGGFAEYVTGSVNGACPIALAVAAGGGGGGAITGGGAGGNASWGSTGATPGGDGGSNSAVDGAGGGAATATAGGGSGAQGHSTNACHDGSSGAAGGFLSGGTGGAGSASVVDAQLNVYCNGGGGGGGGGAGYYGGGGGGSGYDDDPSGGGGGGESYVVSGATVISAGASAVGGWFGFISPFDGGGCGCREKAVSGGATPARPVLRPAFRDDGDALFVSERAAVEPAVHDHRERQHAR